MINIMFVLCKFKILNNGCCMSVYINNLCISLIFVILGNNVFVFIFYLELVCF